MAAVKLGRNPAVHDVRVARMSVISPGLPDPPESSNWWADVEDWQMLGNDEVGDCVVAFAMHFIYQQTRYLSQTKAPVPTTAEAIQNYSAIGGYDPAMPGSDLGLVVMGPGGLVEYWVRTGLLCGGTVHKLTNIVQITKPNPKEWRQAINTFGGMGIGIRLPQSIMDAPELPFIWSNPSGSIAGGHEMFVVGYETVADTCFYDCITWGQRVRLTEAFLLQTFDEGAVPLSTDGLDVAGFNAAGNSHAALAYAMYLLKNEAA